MHLHHPLTPYLEQIMSRRADMHGFTLVELMITLVLLGIIAGIAAPNFNTLIRNNQIQSKAEELAVFLQHVRGQAALNRQAYEVLVDNDSPWIAQVSGSNDPERLLEHSPGIEILSSALSDDKLIYRPNGTATAANITICRDADPTTGYLLEVQPSGSSVLYPRGQKDGTALDSCTP